LHNQSLQIELFLPLLFLLDKNGYNMDIAKIMEEKLAFSVGKYQQILQRISIIDSFRGKWKHIEH